MHVPVSFIPPEVLWWCTAGSRANSSDSQASGYSGAVTLIQRFGSAANLNIHLRCPVRDGIYRRGTDSAPVFVEVPAPTDEALQAVLHKIITRTMKMLNRRGGADRTAGPNVHG